MRWLLLDVGLVAAVLVLLGLCALRIWRKVAGVRSAVGELRGRLETLNTEAATLSERLDVAEVSARLGDRSA